MKELYLIKLRSVLVAWIFYVMPYRLAFFGKSYNLIFSLAVAWQMFVCCEPVLLRPAVAVLVADLTRFASATSLLWWQVIRRGSSSTSP